MKFTQTEKVYRDKVTRVCYTKQLALRPVAVIDGPGKATTFGALLTPYGDHPSVDWDNLDNLGHGPESVKEFGFFPHQWGQDILVTDEQLASRFEYLGQLSKEMDLAAAVAHYEAENCDFSDRAWVSESAIRQLKKMVPGLWACELYTLIKDYMANTPKK